MKRYTPIFLLGLVLLIASLSCGEGTERKAVETAVAGEEQGQGVAKEQDAPTKPPEPTSTPKPAPTPIAGLVGIGTHIVGKDIHPGIYWGLGGEDVFSSCYWGRKSDLSGDLDSIIANDNSIGQYYIDGGIGQNT